MCYTVQKRAQAFRAVSNLLLEFAGLIGFAPQSDRFAVCSVWIWGAELAYHPGLLLPPRPLVEAVRYSDSGPVDCQYSRLRQRYILS